ncbi:MAG: FecR domain-containing protein [Sphingobium sp.]
MASEEKEWRGGLDPDAQARGWIVRLKSGAATGRDLEGLADWRRESHGNEEAFRRAVRLWDDLGPVLAGGGAQAMPLAIAHKSGGVSRRWVLGGAGGLAASVALGLFAVGTPVPAGAQVFETRKGERQRLRLETQMSVDLNTNSRLFYWADNLSPRLMLDRGEAVVSAAFAGERALLVEARDIVLRARTARFLLRSDGDSVRVACLDGKVSIRADGRSHVLTGGMEAEFEGAIQQPDPPEASEHEVAWQRDLLQFTDRPAGEVIAELNRYRHGHVYLLGDRADVRITGVIHLQRADLAVEHIARSLGMKVTRLPGGIAILRG